LEARFPWRHISDTADRLHLVRGALRELLGRAPREDELLRAWMPKKLRPPGSRGTAVAQLRALRRARPEGATRHLYPRSRDLIAVASMLEGLTSTGRPAEVDLGRCALNLETLFRSRTQTQQRPRGRPLLGAIGALLQTAFPKHMTSQGPRAVDQLLRRARGRRGT
jgi:hypothetical protein